MLSTKLSNKEYSKIFLTILIVIFIISPLLRVYNLNSNIADFGFYYNNILHSFDYIRIFDGHFQPIMIIYNCLIFLFPENFKPYFLILIQSVVLLIPFLILYMSYGKIYGIIYILFFPLWHLNLFDFHFEHLLILFTFLFFYFFDKRKYLLMLLCAFLVSLTKEPYTLITIFMGIFLLFSNYKNNFVHGIFLILLGCFLFIIFNFFINEYYELNFVSSEVLTPFTSYLWIINSFNLSFNEFFINLSDVLFQKDKIIIVISLFAIFLYFPFIQIKPILVALPPLGMIILSDHGGYYDYTSHYLSAVVIPFCYCLTKFDLNKIQILNIRTSNIIILNSLVCLFLFGPGPFSRLSFMGVERFTHEIYIPNERNNVIKSAIKNNISIDNTIISSQNNVFYPYIAQGYRIFPFPMAMKENPTLKVFGNPNNIEATEEFIADYILIDEKKEPFLYDVGCDFVFTSCNNKEVENSFIYHTKILNDHYNSIFTYDGFSIYKIKNE
jgi:uncharacterized membrane protein